ncbi:hypothetical protein C900_04489 [Fulvivirga imtechensis AK7]|uniref:Uncharacterized protein n=1 Tax=Fulvivirga imtechensis AK7 TaxID=1237149 RepID=L8JM04_9BACT|nr:hypothetical protein C900_04489 [Fulvivirga imtechensis AK7]
MADAVRSAVHFRKLKIKLEEIKKRLIIMSLFFVTSYSKSVDLLT